MKFLTAFLLALIAMLPLSAQNAIPQHTHEINQRTFIPAQPLTNAGENFNYYDSNGHLYESKSNYWNGSGWELGVRTYYTLNGEGMPTQILDRIWDLLTLKLSDKYLTTITYDANGKENYKKNETWDEATSAWQTDDIGTSVFGPAGNLMEHTVLQYQNNVEIYSAKTFYTYDGADRVIEAIFQSKSNGQWQNTKKVDYQYIGATESFTAETRNWDAVNQAWLPVSSREIETVTNLQTVNIIENFDGLNWAPYYRATYNYNANAQPIAFDYAYWNPDVAAWIAQTKYAITYNADKSMHDFKLFQLDFSSDTLYQSLQSDFDYETYAVAAKTPVLEAQVDLFPNPASDQLNVSIAGQSESNLLLMDMHGKPVAQAKTFGQKAKIALSNQPAGVYFLRIEQNGATKFLPVVIR